MDRVIVDDGISIGTVGMVGVIVNSGRPSGLWKFQETVTIIVDNGNFYWTMY